MPSNDVSQPGAEEQEPLGLAYEAIDADYPAPEFTDNSSQPEDGDQVDAEGGELRQTPGSAYDENGAPL